MVPKVDWLWFKRSFQHFFSHIISVHLLICFPVFLHQYSKQHTFQATGCFSTDSYPIGEWRLSQWLFSKRLKECWPTGFKLTTLGWAWQPASLPTDLPGAPKSSAKELCFKHYFQRSTSMECYDATSKQCLSICIRVYLYFR